MRVKNLEDLSLFKMYPPIILVIPVLAIIFYFLAKRQDANFMKKLNYWIIPFFVTLMILYPLVGFFPSIFLWGAPIVGFILLVVHAQSGSANDNEKFLAYVNGTVDVEDMIDEVDSHPGDFVVGEIYRANKDETGRTPDGEDSYVPSNKKAVLPIHDRFVHMLILGVTGSGKTSQSLLPMFLQDFLSDSFRYENVEVVQMGQIVLEPKGDFAKTVWTFGKLKEREKRYNYMKFLVKSKMLLNDKIQELADNRKHWIDVKNGPGLNKIQAKEFKQLEKKLEDTKTYYSLDYETQIEIQKSYEELKELKYGRELTLEEEGNLRLVEDGLKKLIYIRREIPKYLDINVKSMEKVATYALFQYASNLSYIVANPSLADSAWRDFVTQDPNEQRDVVLLFDPMSKNSPHFNPLYGDEETAVGTVTATLIAFMADSSEYFKNQSKDLMQKAIHVAKRVYGNDATLLHINDLLTNNSGRGEIILKELGAMDTSAARANENRDFRNYFLNDYYSAMKGQKNASKTYEHTSGIRTILNNLLDNSRLRRVLCPPPGIGTGLDFDKILRTGDKVAISTQTGVSDELGAMIGSFLMLQLQDAISRRKGKENTRNPVVCYIDEFQDYANQKFEDVLTKGRSYVVSMVMATQTLGIVEQKAGTGLMKNLQSNARNLIVYPGGSNEDVRGIMELFGQTNETVERRSISQEVEKELTPYEKAKAELGLGDKPAPARESISEDTKPVERFSHELLMYGPNVANRRINSNTAFNFIFYRFVIKNSIQVPSVAKIEYIPYELKKASDAMIQAYESVLEKELRDEEEEYNHPTSTTATSNEDAFGGTSESTYTQTSFAELNKGITKESDPNELAHSESGTQDLSENGVVDDLSVDMGVVDIPQDNLPNPKEDLNLDITIDFDNLDLS